jgi:hypothetical protein
MNDEAETIIFENAYFDGQEKNGYNYEDLNAKIKAHYKAFNQDHSRVIDSIENFKIIAFPEFISRVFHIDGWSNKNIINLGGMQHPQRFNEYLDLSKRFINGFLPAPYQSININTDQEASQIHQGLSELPYFLSKVNAVSHGNEYAYDFDEKEKIKTILKILGHITESELVKDSQKIPGFDFQQFNFKPLIFENSSSQAINISKATRTYDELHKGRSFVIDKDGTLNNSLYQISVLFEMEIERMQRMGDFFSPQLQENFSKTMNWWASNPVESKDPLTYLAKLKEIFNN